MNHQIGELSAEVEYLKVNATLSEKQNDLNHKNSEFNDRSLEDFSRSETKRRELQVVIRDSVTDNIHLREEVQKNLNDMGRQKIAAEAKLITQN